MRDGHSECRACEDAAAVCPACEHSADLELATKDRACAELLELIDRMPVGDYQHLHSIIEVLHCANDYRAPMSGAHPSLGRYYRALLRGLEQQRRVESPIEQKMWEILEELGSQVSSCCRSQLRSNTPPGVGS